jgi:hypothetical protein
MDRKSRYYLVALIVVMGLAAGLFLFFSFPGTGDKASTGSKESLDHFVSKRFADYKQVAINSVSSKERAVISAANDYLVREKGVPATATQSSNKGIKYDGREGKWAVSFRFDYGESDDRHVAIYVVEVDRDLSCSFRGFIEY